MANRRPKKITQEIRGRIVELARQGFTQTQIAKQLIESGAVKSIHQASVSRILRQAEAAAGPIMRRSRPDPRSPVERPVTAPAAPADPTDQTPEQIVRERLDQTREMVRDAKAAQNVTAYRDLAKLEAQLARELAGLTPPEPPDPEKDPWFDQARKRVHDQVARLVERFQAKRSKLRPTMCEACRAVEAEIYGAPDG